MHDESISRDDGLDAPTDDLLIQRAIDGDATDGLWQELERQATLDTSIWERLARALHAENSIRVLTDYAAGAAERVELPLPVNAGSAPPHTGRASVRAPRRLAIAVAAAGWAAALLGFALFWCAGGEPASCDQDARMTAAIPPTPDADRVIRELPREVLFVRPVDAPDAAGAQSCEVVYVRRVLERDVVKEFFTVGTDDTGRPTSIPVQASHVVGYGAL